MQGFGVVVGVGGHLAVDGCRGWWSLQGMSRGRGAEIEFVLDKHGQKSLGHLGCNRPSYSFSM